MHINPYIFEDFDLKVLVKRLFRVFAKKMIFGLVLLFISIAAVMVSFASAFFPSDETKQSIDSSNVSSMFYSFWISADLCQGKINMVFSNIHSESWR